eukprot:TRINITY_DN3666_c0_g1_i1.p1 TRINITY_DN3666_c0_g1~~TRINITY_DN3666_c0_g1_i1.p1  ORF type:complete len:777 (-),score=131.38 TRINITY_DN3666_c0_g1_i1:237-2567(-)
MSAKVQPAAEGDAPAHPATGAAPEPAPSRLPVLAPGGEMDNAKENEQEEKEATEEDILADEGIQLEASAWDSILLVGLKREGGNRLLSHFQVCVAIIIFLFALITQVIFVVVVSTTMAESPINDEAKFGVVEQRLLQNHKFGLMNMRNVQTRTADLCNGNVFNSLNNFYGDVDQYINPSEIWEGSGIYVGGITVASLAILIWILSMTQELRRIFELGYGIVMLPLNKSGDNQVVTDEKEDVYVISRLSLLHKALLLTFVLVPRLVIASMLLRSGSIYLADTLAVSDMILNACALEIVKDVDEYIFEAIMSHKVRELVENTRLQCKAASDSLRAAVEENLPVILRLLFVIIAFVVVFQTSLSEFAKHVRHFQDWTCANDLNFAWETHPVSGMPMFTDVSPSTNKSEPPSDAAELACWYTTKVLLLELRAGFDVNEYKNKQGGLLSNKYFHNDTLAQIVRGEHSTCDKTAQPGQTAPDCPNMPMAALEELSTMSEDTYLTNPQCSDFEVHYKVLVETCKTDPIGYRNFKDSNGNWRTSCEDVAPLCECPVGMSSPDGGCKPEGDLSVALKYGVASVWINYFKAICPKSCGRCSSPPAPAPAASGSGSPSSTGSGSTSGTSSGSTTGSGSGSTSGSTTVSGSTSGSGSGSTAGSGSGSTSGSTTGSGSTSGSGSGSTTGSGSGSSGSSGGSPPSSRRLTDDEVETSLLGSTGATPLSQEHGDSTSQLESENSQLRTMLQMSEQRAAAFEAKANSMEARLASLERLVAGFGASTQPESIN